MSAKNFGQHHDTQTAVSEYVHTSPHGTLIYKLTFKYSMKLFLISFSVISLLSSLASTFASAQNLHTFSGSIKNGETGEILIGASILVKELKTVGVSSNAYGFYSLTIPEGKYSFVIQYIGSYL
jgi:hypothetical protein